MRIEHLHVQNRIDTDLDIVAGDADLLSDIEGLFFQTMAVGDTLGERKEDVESGL